MKLNAEQEARARAVLKSLLDSGEDEVCEYKANRSVTDNEMGEYFSALSNEANLRGADSAWIVFGVAENPKPHTVHSTFKDGPDSINKLKRFIAQHTSDSMPFDNVYEISDGGKRVVLFEIPAAKPGTPTRFKNFAYGRNGDSTSPLPDKKHKRILNQVDGDWTAQAVPEATINDLDPKAIRRARELYKKSRPSMSEECDRMSDAEFLDSIKVTDNGKITRAAMILLGKDLRDRLLPTPNIRIRWVRWEKEYDYSDSEIYNIPFILAVDDIVAKVFSRKREYITPGTVMVNKFDTYDDFVLRESLQNCICHRDYTEADYISVIEFLGDRVEFSNNGDFMPGSVENVIRRQKRSNARNPALMELMSRLGMTEEAGRGIMRMFRAQQDRLFPMPEYDLTEEDWVKVTIYGKDIDMNYRDLLLRNPDLSVTDLYLLDRVQKNKPISDDDAADLRKRGMIAGHKPNYSLDTDVVRIDYDDMKGRILLAVAGSPDGMTREDLDRLLTVPGEIAASNVTYAVRSLVESGKIRNIGSKKKPVYVKLERTNGV